MIDKQAYTPGPWSIEEQLETNCVEVFADFGREDSCVVARAYSWRGDGEADNHTELRESRRVEAQANAVLIAAVLDLLAACEAIRLGLTKLTTTANEIVAIEYTQLVAAIKKAKGER